ncbi:MAG: FtsX-like permease family protein, partial [Bacteroidetes bacterium]|nr:FtsX-like permease family protein [Bacteroidota bacterium]
LVISESVAYQLFGEENPIGNIISYEGYPAGKRDLMVSGVMKDLPENTHLEIDYLASMVGMDREEDNWGSFKPISIYGLLKEGQSVSDTEAKFPGLIQRYLSERSDAKALIFELEPLTRIHLYSKAGRQMKANGNIVYIYLFGGIGLLILLIACINFINLTTARSLTRLKEVGVRKVLGADRSQLIRQFLGESFVITVFALILALGMVEVFLPVFQTITGKTVLESFWNEPIIWALTVVLTLLVSLVSGAYPAFFISKFKPVESFRKKPSQLKPGKWNLSVRSSLVVVQFCISIGLITGVIVVISQLSYLREKDLGFHKEHVLVVPWGKNERPFLSQLEQNPQIIDYAISQNLPVNTRNYDGRSVNPEGMPKTIADAISVQSCITDAGFIPTYGIELIAGRNFSKKLITDSASFIINETAVKTFGWESPEAAIGKELRWSGSFDGHVIGVVKDFHLESMHESIDPLVMLTEPTYNWWKGFISLRLKPENLTETLTFVENNWRNLNPDGVYDYFFIDDSFQQLHEADQRFGNIVGYFAFLAIVIACIGLFGLIAFAAERRRKEMGIRKVLGASVKDLIWLITREFFFFILIASILAIPASWYLLNSWLGSFAYHIDLGIQNYFLSAGLTFFIGWLVMSYQSFAVARLNPVESLRDE